MAKDRGAKPLSEETASGSQTPRQGRRHSGFKVSSKRPTHSERPERGLQGEGPARFCGGSRESGYFGCDGWNREPRAPDC